MASRIASIEERMAAAVLADQAAKVQLVSAKSFFHATWRPMVILGAVTFGDWWSSWTRANAGNHGLTPQEAYKSGWCMACPGLQECGFDEVCKEAEDLGRRCGGTGCPGPTETSTSETETR